MAFGSRRVVRLIGALVSTAAIASGPAWAQPAPQRPAFAADPAGHVVRSGGQAVRLEVVASGLDTPWGLAFLPDGRLLVTERSGRLRIVGRDGKLLPGSVSGLPEPWVRQDAGYLDVTVHPNYARNGWIYLSYVELAPGQVPPPPAPAGAKPAPSPPSNTVIIRGRLGPANAWVDSQVIWRAPAALYRSDTSHYGSRFLWGRDGRLFFTLGDRGDPSSAQDLGSPFGKIHRINDDGDVPPDNPFVGKPGALPTIWSYGHRNPQGLSYDPVSGLLWSTEHGPSGGDEINIVEKGGNYGWALATMGKQPGVTRREAPGTEPPVAHYTPSIGPSGILFYAGSRYPAWRGQMFLAALVGQELRRYEIKGRAIVSQEPVFRQFGRTRNIVVGPDGLMYVLLQNPTGAGSGLRLSDPSEGKVVRLVPVS